MPARNSSLFLANTSNQHSTARKRGLFLAAAAVMRESERTPMPVDVSQKLRAHSVARQAHRELSLRPSHKRQGRHADADGWWQIGAQGDKAGVKGGASDEYVI